MNKKILKEIEKLHYENKHRKIIDIIESINENERDYEIISLLARALNNIKHYDEALDNLMYMREEGIDDPLWYYRVGFAYFYKDDQKLAKQYFKKNIELLNEKKKNIKNTSILKGIEKIDNYNDNKEIDKINDILEDSNNLYKLCITENIIPFNKRVDDFWEWFEENEYQISMMLENGYEELFNFVHNGIKIISEDLKFNINKDYVFNFFVDRNISLFFLTSRIIETMPEKFKNKWKFLPCMNSSNGINFSVQMNDKNIIAEELLVKIEFDENKNKFDLKFFHKELHNFQIESYNICFLMTANAIGENLSQIYIRYIEIYNKKIEGMIPITNLEEYIKKTLSEYKRDLIINPINNNISYNFNTQNINMQRYDIISGTTSNYDTIDDYYNRDIDNVYNIYKLGANLMFLSYVYCHGAIDIVLFLAMIFCILSLIVIYPNEEINL